MFATLKLNECLRNVILGNFFANQYVVKSLIYSVAELEVYYYEEI